MMPSPLGRRRMPLAGLAFPLLAALAPAAAQTAPAQDKPRTTLVIGISQAPHTLNPLYAGQAAVTYVNAMMRRPLLVYDKDWKLVCLLCTEAPSPANGRRRSTRLADGSTGIAITHTIHPNATWGDGTPVTTKDVVFTWEAGRHQDAGVYNRAYFANVERIDVADDKTFTLHSRSVDFRQVFLLPAHLERKVFEEDPRTYRTRTRADREATNPGLYYGPYLIVEYNAGSEIVLAPNPHWFGAKPHFTRIVVKVVATTAAIETELVAGGIDYMAGEIGLAIEEAVLLEARHPGRFRFVYKPGLVYENLVVDLRHKALGDKRVRQALLMALDRPAIAAAVYGGRNPVAHSFALPEEEIGEAGIRRYPFDPAAARRLLDEAGWSDMRDGVRHDRAGEPLAFTLVTTAGNRGRAETQRLIAQQWRAVGVSVRLDSAPADTLFRTVLPQRKFGGMVLAAIIRTPYSELESHLTTANIPTPANNFAGQNYSGFRGVDDLFRDLRSGRGAPAELRVTLQRRVTEELPHLPLFFRSEAHIVPPWLEGVEPTGHNAPATHWIEQWRAK